MAITNYSTLQTTIAEEISYDPASGLFVWKTPGHGRQNKPVGTPRPDGYLTICVNKRQWLAHRLAWVLHYGEEPPRVIDHINRDKSDNRIENLRDGSNGINEMNAKPPSRSPFGICGVRLSGKNGNFQAYIARRGKFKSFYNGNDFFEACCARKSAENKFWEAAK